MMLFEARLHDDYLALLKEASDFYVSRGDVFTTLRNLTRHLDVVIIPGTANPSPFHFPIRKKRLSSAVEFRSSPLKN